MEVLISLWNLIVALADLIVAVIGVVAPWAPLIAWIAFWLFAVNWAVLYPILVERGGIVGVILIALMAVLVWGTIAPTEAGHEMFGLAVSNFVGKTVYVTSLLVIAFLCGSVQLS
ncbi:Uncharacterized protein SCF082_LOCUS19426, partial [Durusdinium trenchii]